MQFDDINLDDTENVTDTLATPTEPMEEDADAVSVDGDESIHDDTEIEDDLEDILPEPESIDGENEEAVETITTTDSATQDVDPSGLSDTMTDEVALPEMVDTQEPLAVD